MGGRGRWLEGAGWVVLALSVAAAVAETYASPATFAQLAHADFQYLSALSLDLIEQGGRLADWTLPPSPYFFPDLAVHLVLRLLSANPDWLTIASAAVLAAGTALAAARLATRVAGTEGAALQALVLLSAMLLAYAWGWSGEAVGLLCLSNHGGALVMGLACLLLVDRPTRQRLAFAAGLVIVTSLSDPLFAIAWALPVAALAATSAAPIPLRAARGLSLLAACAMGLLVHSWLPVPPTQGPRFRWEYLHSGAADFFTHLGEPTGAPVYLGLLAAAVALLRTRGDPSHRPLLLALLLTFPLSLLGLWVIGAPAGSWGSRYLVHLHVVLAIVAPAALAGQRNQPWLSWALAFAAAVVALVSFGQRAPNLGRVGHVTLAPVACFDDFFRTREVHRCVAAYWEAKPIAVLAQKRITTVQVFADGQPDWWINTRRHYAEEEVVDCAVLPTVQAAFFSGHFGPPDEIQRCDDTWILLYRGPKREALNRTLRPLLQRDGTRK